MTSRTYDRPKRLGAKLRAVRKHLGVSQTGMKQLLNFKGDYGRISEFERGKRQAQHPHDLGIRQTRGDLYERFGGR